MVAYHSVRGGSDHGKANDPCEAGVPRIILIDMKTNVWIAGLLLAMLYSPKGNCQQSADSLPRVSRASSLMFMERDGTYIDAGISKIDATEITVQPYGKPPITIQRKDLVQISQDGEGVAEHMAVATFWRPVRLVEVGDFE